MSVDQGKHFKLSNSGAQISTAREEAQNAWQMLVKPVIELLADQMPQMEYTGHPVKLSQPTTDKEIEKAFDFLLKKINANINGEALRWTNVRKEYSHFQDFIQNHCKTSGYCLEIKKVWRRFMQSM
jgi:hypothetical protein